VKYVGVDWAYRTAQWCALDLGGEIAGEGRISAGRDGLARLVLELGAEMKACLEMMSGALWVRDELVGCGWQVEVADARKVKTVAPLAAKTDKVDARLLAELCRPELVPALWLPSLDERRCANGCAGGCTWSACGPAPRIASFGLQTQWGVRVSLAWAAVEAAQQAWRESNPWHQLYVDVGHRSRHSNAAKAAVARKILIAAWQMLSRKRRFHPAPRRTSVPASSRLALAA